MDIDLWLACRRAVVTTSCAVVLALTAAAPAGAHVEVTAERPQAGTGPVTLAFSAESESVSAGIVAVKTRLPEGISPGDVSLAGGPAGWALTPTADGFEVAGPDIGPGVNAEYGVTVTRLPADRTDLVFPTLQRYSDGREDAWIEPVTDAVPDPQMPAPVLTVAPAAPGAPATAAAPTANDTTATAPSATAPADANGTRPDASAEPAVGDSNAGTIALVVALAILAGLGAAYRAARKRRA